MHPTDSRSEAVAVVFKDGRRLFGVWSPWTRHLSAPLFQDLGGAQRHLDRGISRLVNIEFAEQSAEDVEVRTLAESDAGALLLATRASWPEAYVVGPCESKKMGDPQSVVESPL